MMHTPGVPELREQASQSPTTEKERPRGGAANARVWLSLLALLTLCSALRLWKLELDPPAVVVRGYRGQAHYRDEAAKAHEARNKAKWDQWSLSAADEYGFWRAQSPACNARTPSATATSAEEHAVSTVSAGPSSPSA